MIDVITAVLDDLSLVACSPPCGRPQIPGTLAYPLAQAPAYPITFSSSSMTSPR